MKGRAPRQSSRHGPSPAGWRRLRPGRRSPLGSPHAAGGSPLRAPQGQARSYSRPCRPPGARGAGERGLMLKRTSKPRILRLLEPFSLLSALQHVLGVRQQVLQVLPASKLSDPSTRLVGASNLHHSILYTVYTRVDHVIVYNHILIYVCIFVIYRYIPQKSLGLQVLAVVLHELEGNKRHLKPLRSRHKAPQELLPDLPVRDTNLWKEDHLQIVAVACPKASSRVADRLLVLVMWHFLTFHII